MAKTTGMDRRPANLGAGIYERLLRPDRDAEEANDHAWSGQIDQRVSALDITSPGSVLTERRKERNGWNLAPGVYGGFEHSASLNAITGVSHGAKINRHCTFNNQSTVVGVEFTDEGDPSMRELVRVVSPDGERPNCVVFINCRFTRGAYAGCLVLPDLPRDGGVGCLCHIHWVCVCGDHQQRHWHYQVTGRRIYLCARLCELDHGPVRRRQEPWERHNSAGLRATRPRPC